MKLYLNVYEQYNEAMLDENYSAYYDNHEKEISFDLYVNKNDINSIYGNCILNDKLKDSLISAIDLCLDKTITQKDKEEYNKYVQSLLNEKNLFNKIDKVIFNGTNYETIKTIIDNNKCLNEKNIIIDNRNVFNNELVLEAKKYFSGYNNVKMIINGNKKENDIESINKSTNYINTIAENIKKYNFSELETVLYVYDFVRQRIYTRENENEDYEESRDITNVINGKKIVCAGYANIFDKILKELNINTDFIYLINKKNPSVGHARNYVYLNDDKYNIHGIYECDTTWDSKKNEDDDKYLNSYRFFMKTKKEMDQYDNKVGYLNETFLDYYDTILDEFITNTEDGTLSNVPKDVLKTINLISNIIDKKSIIPILYLSDITLPENMIKMIIGDDFSISDVENRLYEYEDLMDNKINANTLLKALYNVRKVQFYEDDIKFPFSINSFYTSCVISNWSFESKNMSNLLQSIFGNDIKGKSKIDFINYIDSENLDLNIERVKLAKTIRKLYNTKK